MVMTARALVSPPGGDGMSGKSWSIVRNADTDHATVVRRIVNAVRNAYPAGIGEEIVIDGTVRLSIVAVKGDRVRIGIAAPPSVTVDRKEIHDSRAELTIDAPSAFDAQICAPRSALR